MLALLGVSKTLPKVIRRLVDIGLLIARHRVAVCWSRGPPPSLTCWSKDMLYSCTQTENYSELLRPLRRPKNFWKLYRTYLSKKDNVDGSVSSVLS